MGVDERKRRRGAGWGRVSAAVGVVVWVVAAPVARGATLAELLAGKQAIQCYRQGDDVWCKDLVTAQSWKVFTRAADTVEGWVGAINQDGTKLTCNDGTRTAVIGLDGSNHQFITSGDSTNGHFWRDGSDNDWIVYTGELENKDQSGTTWRVQIDATTNAPLAATRELLVGEQYSAGLGGSGTYLAESYGAAYLYNLETSTKSIHLNGVQNCVGSANAGSEPWMMYERDVYHHDIVVSQWNEVGNTARYIWQYNDANTTIWSTWSSTDNEFCTIEKDTPKALYLVKLQVDISGSGDNVGSYEEAAMGIAAARVGGVWIGDPVVDAPPTLTISSPGEGDTVSGTVTVTGTASDDQAVASVACRLDSAAWSAATGTDGWSCSLDSTTVADGAHTITARATDSAAQTQSASLGVTVANGGSGTATVVLKPVEGATATADLTDREYFTAGQSLRGNEDATPVVIGAPVFTPSGSSFTGRWTFVDDGSDVDQGGTYVLSSSANRWSVPLTGDGTPRVVTVYGNVWHGEAGSVDYQITAAGAAETLTHATVDAALFAVEVTFTGSVTVAMQPLSTLTNANFTLCAVATGTDADQEKPSIEVLEPVGAEIWEVGSTQRIRWSTVRVSDVKLRYSVDGGETWSLIESSIDNENASWLDYPWQVPDRPTTRALVQIADYSDTSRYDESDAVFEIRSLDRGGKVIPVTGGCNCNSGHSPAAVVGFLALGLLRRRRRALRESL